MKKNKPKYRFTEYTYGKMVTRELDIQALYKNSVRKARQRKFPGKCSKPKSWISNLFWRKAAKCPTNGLKSGCYLYMVMRAR
jgi:hypothetical protein